MQLTTSVKKLRDNLDRLRLKASRILPRRIPTRMSLNTRLKDFKLCRRKGTIDPLANQPGHLSINWISYTYSQLSSQAEIADHYPKLSDPVNTQMDCFTIDNPRNEPKLIGPVRGKDFYHAPNAYMPMPPRHGITLFSLFGSHIIKQLTNCIFYQVLRTFKAKDYERIGVYANKIHTINSMVSRLFEYVCERGRLLRVHNPSHLAVRTRDKNIRKPAKKSFYFVLPILGNWFTRWIRHHLLRSIDS